MAEAEDYDIARIRMQKMIEFQKEITNGNKANVEWPNKPVNLTSSTFNDYIKKYPLVIVDLWAEWCGPCKMIGPVVEQLASEMKGKVAFGKVNVDYEQKIASNYHVSGIPTLLVFRDGQLADRIVGALPKGMLVKRINTYLK